MDAAPVKALTMMVLVASLFVAGCKAKPQVVHVPITSKGCSAAFVSEHNDLFAENIRLKSELRLLRQKP